MRLTRKKLFRRQSRSHDRIVKHAGLEMLEGRRLLSTYYASPSGSDSASGSLTQPFASLSKAISTAKSGDKIILRAGTYQGNVTINKPNITLEGLKGEQAKIVASTASGSNFSLYLGTEASGTVLRNLDISGGYYYALKTETTRSYDDTNGNYHGTSDVLIENVKLHDSGTHVVKLSPDSDRITFRNCEIYNSGVRDPNQGQGIDAVNVDDLLFEDNYIHDTTQNALFVKGGSQRCLILNNRIDDAGFSGILLGQSTDAGAFDTRQNPLMYEAIDCVARGNVVVNPGYSGLGTYSALRTTFENNIVRGAASRGQAGIFFSTDGTVGQDATVRGNTIEVVPGAALVSIVSGAFNGNPKFSNNHYHGSNRFVDNRSGFSGSLSSWQARGYDAGSTYIAGAPAFSGDLNHDGKMNIDDYTVIDYVIPLGGAEWWKADVNLDGAVDTDDYVVMDVDIANVLADITAPASVMEGAQADAEAWPTFDVVREAL